ncbi:hypothetical protein VTN49DRAFT_6368 [Thermomyces lanuginosus]|uniref:uncharacterized protein n=1 Tax=Thermomyces lanuginosus TaxID=5541 RepID=UPI00374216F1
MSEASSSQGVLSRYRPVLYFLAGVTAVYALVHLHSTVVASSRQSTPSLRRRNAIRRSRQSDQVLTQTPSWRAIRHLEELESEDGVYGTFRIETEDGRRMESGLLPSLLATRDQLMAEIGVPAVHAERVREMMEDTFLESFFALEYPSTHYIPEGSREFDFLVNELHRRGISRSAILRVLDRFNANDRFGEDIRQRRQNEERLTLSTPLVATASPPEQSPLAQTAPDGGETTVDDRESLFSWHDGNIDGSPSRDGQNLLNLLYHIAEDQARRDGYIHRGVTCNSCGAMPIQGIRYRCANCIDYDLCETCEAMQVHIKTHLFYKVRIPAPFLGNPRQSQPVWYPGKPSMLPRSLPRHLARRFIKETNFENPELDALWDQFRCLANVEWPEDPCKLGMAIDRKTFDRCFVPNTSIRPPPPSLIYDRMFAFYDTNGDNLIGFEEFLKGLASFNNKSADEKMRRIFRGYDIDGDGYVERKDFLRMFRAYYALSRELTRDMVAGMEDDFLDGVARDVVLGSQPISSAFPGNIPAGDVSRTGEGKRMNPNGDMEIVDGEGVLRPDGTDTGDPHSIIGDAAVRRSLPEFDPMPTRLLAQRANQHSISAAGNAVSENERGEASRSLRENDANQDPADNDDMEDGSSESSDDWPPAEWISEEDIVNALGTYVPLEEVTDRDDRARITSAFYQRMHEEDLRRMEQARQQGVRERWQRRMFYIDEEDGATAPPECQDDPDFGDYVNEDKNATANQRHSESGSRPPTPRSRSSSKVRFEDDDFDVRSNPSTSSRSIPVGERWGGFEVPEVEKDVGKEILYQATQEGFNELLDALFKEKEDLMMEVYRTRAERRRWAKEIEMFEQSDPKKRHKKKNSATTAATVPGNAGNIERHSSTENNVPDSDDSLQNAGHSMNPDTGMTAQVEPEALSSPVGSQPQVSSAFSEPEDSRDPTLPQNRPEGLDLEQFPSLSAEPTPDHSFGDGLNIANRVDPTLPQNRPNEDSVDVTVSDHRSSQRPQRLRFQAGSSTTSVTTPSPEAEGTTATKPSSATSDSSSSSGKGKTGSPREQPPSPEVLARWSYLNQVEREAQKRGGGAKLNFEEFRRKMKTDQGRRLAFVGSWIEMASF